MNHADSPTARARFGMPSVCNYTAKLHLFYDMAMEIVDYASWQELTDLQKD